MEQARAANPNSATDFRPLGSQRRDEIINHKKDEMAEKHFGRKYQQLREREKRVLHHLAERTYIARSVAQDYSEQLTFGQSWPIKSPDLAAPGLS